MKFSIPILEKRQNEINTKMNTRYKKPHRIQSGNVNMEPLITVDQFKNILKKQPKPVSHEESDLQQECVAWFNSNHPQYWLFSVKNSSKMGGKTITAKSGKQIPLEAIIAKREGLRAGVADLQLLFGNGEHYSLFLEMKTETGTQTKEQKEFEAYCNANKFKYVVIRTLIEFINTITAYINKSNPTK